LTDGFAPENAPEVAIEGSVDRTLDRSFGPEPLANLEVASLHGEHHVRSSDWSHSIELTVSQFMLEGARPTRYVEELFYAEELAQVRLGRQLELHQIAIEEFQESTKNTEFVRSVKVGTAASIVAGATAGIAVWSISGTYLASLAFSSLPAWVRIDPIFVVGHALNKDEDDTSVADIIANQQKSASEGAPSENEQHREN